MFAIRQSRRDHTIAYPGTYKAKTGIPEYQKDKPEEIQEQIIMADLQEYAEDKAYPGGDSYSKQALSDVPSKELQHLISSLGSLRPGGNTPVNVT